jgi:2-(1,2-epoxy-1,2-dihydrophenyl)acetyl-CoA isomerase
MRKTQELMLTNRRLSAAEALDWGVVNQVVADDELHKEAMALASKLANGPTRAYGQVKKLLLATFENTLESQMELEARGIAAMTTTPDGKEGITAFLEKRKPEYTGA